jgi:hypothetical protein
VRPGVRVVAAAHRMSLKGGFGGMNIILEEHGFSESELEAMSRGLLEVLEQAGMAA